MGGAAVDQDLAQAAGIAFLLKFHGGHNVLGLAGIGGHENFAQQGWNSALRLRHADHGQRFRRRRRRFEYDR